MLWDDGDSAWQRLPQTLHNKLNGRQKRLPGVEALFIGPRGEWFVRFLDGSWRTDYDTLADSCWAKLCELQGDSHEVTSILFGVRRSWAILYS